MGARRFRPLYPPLLTAEANCEIVGDGPQAVIEFADEWAIADVWLYGGLRHAAR